MIWKSIVVVTAFAVLGGLAVAQENRPPSPRGTASVQALGKYGTPPNGRGAPALGGEAYQGGRWIDITYGRPLKRGRDLWGSGANYGKAALVGAPIWRAGADVSTRLKTEIPLVVNGTTIAPGEYSLFIDLKESNWTLVVSTWRAQQKYDTNDKTALWGAYDYTPDKDVLRATMTMETLPHSREELTWEFIDMTDAGGSVAISWDKQMAYVPFTFGH
jgi:hypothetical protein